jgi:microsomal epoxide hydrolase
MHVIRTALCLVVCLMARGHAADRVFLSSDGVRLHYIEQDQGHSFGRTLVLVPGWTMPAWIFQHQIDDLSRNYRVIAFDPRGQGDSDIPAAGYEPYRRGRDIAELLAHIGGPPPVLLGWSLGVLDVLSYTHQFGDGHIAGLVLIDNSVGAGAPPRMKAAPKSRVRRKRAAPSRETYMRSFVRAMFRVPQPPDYIDRLTETALRTPPADAAALLRYPVPRSFWKAAIDADDKPILYIVTPRLAAQADELAAHHPDTDTIILHGVGHAMFVDNPTGFDQLLTEFLHRRVWR